MFSSKSYFAVLLLTAAFLSQEGVQGSSLSNWIKMNRHLVCFQGRANRFGSFHNYVRSGLVVAIKLRHVYGHIRCAHSSSHNSYWGCRQFHSLLHYPFDVVVTDKYNHVLFPRKRYQRMRNRGGMWYWLPFVNTASSKEIIFTEFANPFFFPKYKQMRIWYGEDLKGYTEGDNYGRVCVNVYAKFLY